MGLWTDKKLFDRVKDCLAQGEKKYVRFNRARDSIVDYVRPDLGSEVSEHGDGSFFGQNIYEGTATWSLGTMATGFQGGIITEDSDWLLHRMKQIELKGIDELDIWLQDVKRYLSEVYQQSNLFTVLPLFTRDGLSIGSPLMFIEEDALTQTIKFMPQHYKTVFLFYNKHNELIGIIIKDPTWTVKDIFDKFAPSAEEAEKKLSKTINNELRQGQYHTEHTIIRAVFNKSDPLWDVEGFAKPVKDWISVYFEEETEEDRKNEPLRTEDYFTLPGVVWDYDKKPWESISRTPAFDAIYDVIGHQHAHKDLQENRQLKNRFPRIVNEDYRNVIDFAPEGVTYVKKSDFGAVVDKFDVIGDIRLTRDELEHSAQTIKRWFHTDKFLKFNELTKENKQPVAATQIIKMAAEIATQLSPAISTYTAFLRSVDDRIIDIESRAGRGPFDKETMENITDIVLSNVKTRVKKISVIPVFVGPLARAQKVKQELDPILDGLGAAGPLFALDPDLVNAVRLHPTLDDILTATNFPMKNFVPKDEYDQIKAALVEQRQQEKQALLEIEMAKVADKVSGPVDETSVLASVAGGAT